MIQAQTVYESIYPFTNYKYRDFYFIIGVCVAVRNKNLNKNRYSMS